MPFIDNQSNPTGRKSPIVPLTEEQKTEGVMNILRKAKISPKSAANDMEYFMGNNISNEGKE